MTQTIKIALADDHVMVRQSLAMALSADHKFEVIVQAENGKILLDQLALKRVDVVLLDLQMPVMNGWLALEKISAMYPSIKVVVVSMHFETVTLKDLISKGVRGFLPKNSDFQTLINAINEVNDLGYFFGGKISKSIVRELLITNEISPSYGIVTLNEKEKETLRLICLDKVPKEIAEEMKVTERTVDRYRSSLYKKTGTKTSAGLVLFALKNNFFVLAD